MESIQVRLAQLKACRKFDTDSLKNRSVQSGGIQQDAEGHCEGDNKNQGISLGVSAPPPLPAVPAKGQEEGTKGRMLQEILEFSRLLQLCTALTVIRRTACCLHNCGVRVAYLYLKHMLLKMPR
jgi:hypothetical protein